MSLKAIWLGWTPYTLTQGLRGPNRGAGWGSGASPVHFGGKFIKQKLQGAPDLVGAGHLFGPQIRMDLGPLSFWSHGHSL